MKIDNRNENYFLRKIKNMINCVRTRIKFKMNKKPIYIGHQVGITKSTEFEGYSDIAHYVSLYGSFVGRGTQISKKATLNFTKIGRFTSIGENVSVVIGNHPTHTFASTHPAFYSSMCQAGFTFTEKSIFREHSSVNEKYVCEIGSDVWIGNNVLLINGVKIGDGAIIGAGSVVTKDIPPYSIAVGSPARIIRKRFDDAIIDKLLDMKWYNWDMDKIEKHAHLFDDVNKLIEHVYKK